MSNPLEAYCVKKGLDAELAALAEEEECLLLLASEKLWDDIAVMFDEMKIAKRHRPFLKAALIKMTRAASGETETAPVCVSKESTTVKADEIKPVESVMHDDDDDDQSDSKSTAETGMYLFSFLCSYL